MLDGRSVDLLLEQLCVQLGFCLAPSERTRLRENCPDEPGDFVRAVLLAEGLELDGVDRHLHRQVLASVTRAYAEASENAETNDED